MARYAVLGATGTIGSAIVRRLIAEGHRVLIIGRDAEKVSQLAADTAQDRLVLELSESQPLIDALVADAESRGPLGGIVNCVGSLLLKPAHGTSDAEFRQTLETNLFSAFATTKAAGRVLRDHGGSVVFFSSAAAEIGLQNHEAISAAKAGVAGLARSAAATYAPFNIRVNVISPGLIKTGLTRRIWENAASNVASSELHALGRLGEPEQVASLAVWLLAPENDWVTGQTFGIDGGLSSVLPRRKM